VIRVKFDTLNKYTTIKLVIKSLGIKIIVCEPEQFARSKLIDDPDANECFGFKNGYGEVHIAIVNKIYIDGAFDNGVFLTIPRTPEISREIRDYMAANPDKKY